MIKLDATVRLRAYDVLATAIEDAIATGWRRAHKYTPKPTPEAVQEDIGVAVMGALADLIDFGDP